MTKLLKPKYSKPLEREFEAWIVQGIEKYFNRINTKVEIFAVSPSKEATWPADERINFNGKFLGLQFKRAKLAKNKNGYNGLKWSLNNPTGQFNLIVNNPEIYYCLPTFINRSFKEEALHHCLFWRPDSIKSKCKVAWYDNCKSARTQYCKLKDEMRWGYFAERILACKIGKTFDEGFNIHSYLKTFSKELEISQVIYLIFFKRSEIN